jgi:pimeloyl-ACP methyl ester carboxylesterase
MLALSDRYWGIAIDQRGYGESDFRKKVDATRGAGDWADDAVALLDHLSIKKAHVLGCSMGGNTVWQMMHEYPEKFLSVILVNPASPYGFGGTKDVTGTPCFEDFAGSGGGLRNQELIERVLAKDRSSKSEFSPRVSLKGLFTPSFSLPREEELLSSVLATHIGEKDIPGDFVTSPNWPYLGPGVWGANNATSPKYVGDISNLFDGRLKVPVLWIRGAQDDVISDYSHSDTGTLGSLGVIPGWPGDEVFPPQPMISQTRYVLEKYVQAGGTYSEVIIENSGHIPFIDQPDKFNQVFHDFIGTSNG